MPCFTRLVARLTLALAALLPGVASASCPAPGELNAALAAASASIQGGDYAATLTTLQPFAALGCDPHVTLLAAAAEEGSGDLPSATKTLEDAHGRWPADEAVTTSLARSYMLAGEGKQAAATLEGFHPAATSTLPQLQLAALVYLQDHQLVRGREAAELAYKGYPSLQTVLLLANALQLEGRYKDVLALLNAQRQAYGQSAPFLITVAESEFDAKEFDHARADLEAAVRLDPKRYQAHYLLGNVLFQTGEFDRAVAEYRGSLALSGDQPRTYYQLALALRSKQDEAGEQDALTHALAADPHYAAAHCELGRILLGQDRLADAVAQLNAAIEDNPHTEQAYYLLSKAYERQGDHARSDAMAKRLSEVREANHHSSEP